MRVITSPVHLGHDPRIEITSGESVPAWEVPGRAEAIRRALAADPAFDLGAPAGHGLEPVLAVHDPGLVRYLEEAWSDWAAAAEAAGSDAPPLVPDTVRHAGFALAGGPPAVLAEPVEPAAIRGRVGHWCFDTATAIVAGTWAAARSAVDVALTAADAILAGEPVAYGICRPPGHHAGRAMFGGYCYLNNAAIAVEHLMRRGAGRVGILDLDFHHGNGTQALFWERADVAYASLHGDPDRVYPYFSGRAIETGAGPGAGATFNQPLPAGTDDDAYLVAVERALHWLADRHDGSIVVSLGLDTYGLDPICDFTLTTPGYHAIGRRVAATGARLVVLQEGGYYLPDLGANARSWLRGAAGLPFPAAEPDAAP